MDLIVVEGLAVENLNRNCINIYWILGRENEMAL